MQNLFCKPLYVIIKVKTLSRKGIFTPCSTRNAFFSGKRERIYVAEQKILNFNVIIMYKYWL